MKKNILSIVATFVAFMFTTNMVNAAGVQPDSRVSARAFALQTPDYYTFSGGISSEDEGGSWVNFNGKTNLELEIIELQIGGEMVWSSEEDGRALPAFPFPENIRTIYFYLNGRKDGDWRTLSYGSAVLQNPQPGDPVVIEMRPAELDQIFKFEAPDGVNENDLVMVHGEYRYNLGWYDERFDSFVIQLDPLRGEQSYEIIDSSTGIVLRRGFIAPFEEAPEEVLNTGVMNIRLAGGVQWVRFGENSYQAYSSQQFEATTTYDGSERASKSYFFEGDVSGLSTNFYFRGHSNVRILVEEVTESGEMPVLIDIIPDVDEDDPDYGRVNFDITAGTTAVIITVLVGDGPNGPTPFHVSFNRGGGKG
jgi:hypothetical protein